MPEEALGHNLENVHVAAEIVAAYVSNNSVPAAELPSLIVGIHRALNDLGNGTSQNDGEQIEKPTPARIRKSIAPDALISFIDGKAYKTLKRHLAGHGFDSDSYRERYGLPRDYPMVAASYAAQRSELAKALGLGRKRAGSSAGTDQG
jgi:predicted transcriptional regulator